MSKTFEENFVEYGIIEWALISRFLRILTVYFKDFGYQVNIKL